MKHLWVLVFLAGLAGLEFFHELASADAPRAMCMAPQTAQDAAHDLLFQHLQGHR